MVSQFDGSQLRTVFISATPQTPPSCCAHSTKGEGFPCWHATAVISEKYGSVNLHKFTAKRHLTETWKRQYSNVEFETPSQASMDKVMRGARLLLECGDNVQVPKALPPPRGRPVKNAGKRHKGWYERGPAAKKHRSYSCSLCHLSVHSAPSCPLRQIFDDDDNGDTFL